MFTTDLVSKPRTSLGISAIALCGWLSILAAPAAVADPYPSQVLPPPQFAGYQALGRAMAMDDNFMVVGAPQQSDKFTESGAAYVFRRDVAGNWASAIVLSAPQPNNLAHFGATVAIGGDHLFISAPGERRVYVFVNNNDLFQFATTLEPSQGQVDDGFGSALAAVPGFVAIASPLADNGALVDAGKVDLFFGNNANWNGQPVPFVPPAGARMGSSLALVPRAPPTSPVCLPVLAIGLPGANNGAGAQSGLVWVLAGDQDDCTFWAGPPTIVSPSTAQAGDRFGFSLAMFGVFSANGSRLAVGAPGLCDPESCGSTHGSLYAFVRTGTASLSETRLESLGSLGNDFGRSVAMSSQRLIVGMPQVNFAVSYDFDGGSATWVNPNIRAAAFPSTGLVSLGHYASSVVLNSDMEAIGAPDFDLGDGNKGRVFVYRLDQIYHDGFEDIMVYGIDF